MKIMRPFQFPSLQVNSVIRCVTSRLRVVKSRLWVRVLYVSVSNELQKAVACIQKHERVTERT